MSELTGKEARQRLNSLIQEVESNKAELDGVLNHANEIKGQLDTISSDANNKLGAINLIETQINQKQGSAGQILVEMGKKRDEANTAKEAAEQSREKINALEKLLETLTASASSTQERSTELTSQIEAQLGIATAGTLAHTFNDRKKELQTSLNKWFRWLIADLILLFFVVAGIIIWELKGDNGITYNLILKLTISFPLIYAAYFFHGQYDEEKRLLEEYAFKSAVSLSLEAYRELLKQEVAPGQDKTKLVEFVIGSINQIYTPPRETFSKYSDQKKDISVGVLKTVADIFRSFIGK